MLAGSHIRLRAWREADVVFFHSLRNDFETQQLLLADARPQTMDQVRCWLNERTTQRDQVFFVVAISESDEAVGFVELRGIQPKHGWAQLGICLAPAVRGRRWGREALELLERFARDVIGLRKIILQVLAAHRAAVTLYEQTGYLRVGAHQAHFHHGGIYHDVLVMEKVLVDSSAEKPSWTR